MTTPGVSAGACIVCRQPLGANPKLRCGSHRDKGPAEDCRACDWCRACGTDSRAAKSSSIVSCRACGGELSVARECLELSFFPQWKPSRKYFAQQYESEALLMCVRVVLLASQWGLVAGTILVCSFKASSGWLFVAWRWSCFCALCALAAWFCRFKSEHLNQRQMASLIRPRFVLALACFLSAFLCGASPGLWPSGQSERGPDWPRRLSLFSALFTASLSIPETLRLFNDLWGFGMLAVWAVFYVRSKGSRGGRGAAGGFFHDLRGSGADPPIIAIYSAMVTFRARRRAAAVESAF